MESTKPLVSVLITCYNGLPHLVKAVQCIQEQSYDHWELIIVDDHSVDNSFEKARTFAKTDTRIKSYINPQKGRGTALNFGLSKCSGTFVAINDADDFSMPQRLEKQVHFLLENKEYGLVGSMSDVIDLKSYETTNHSFDRPVTDKKIREYFLMGQPIQHVTVMFRKHLIDQIGGYNERIKFLFDRDLFLRLARITKLYNLPEKLVLVGEHQERFFQYNYTGRERLWLGYHYQLKAIDWLGFPKRKKLRIYMLYFWSSLPLGIRKFIKRI